jgi:hypothetical protein
LVLNRLKSAVVLDLTVPPRMVSRATCVEATDFRGHEPYQLRVLWTCFPSANRDSMSGEMWVGYLVGALGRGGRSTQQ